MVLPHPFTSTNANTILFPELRIGSTRDTVLIQKDELFLISLDEDWGHRVGYRGVMRNIVSGESSMTPAPRYLLIANELPLQREVLAGALHALRPAIPVRVIPPVELDATVASLRPWLVICSASSRIIDELVPAWILLHPDAGGDAMVRMRGTHHATANPTLEELLCLIDQAWALPSEVTVDQ